MRIQKIESWGRLSPSKCEVTEIRWPDNKFPDTKGTLLAYGLGRSYGDSCLNPKGTICLTRPLRLLSPVTPEGRMTCGGGSSLEEILETFVPQGWFPPVVPGTKFVTVAGAIANDIHGKNHHIQGTWGRHTESLLLLRSDYAAPILCSREENADLFRATIGGLGLTGIILEATIRLQKISSAWIDMESIPFSGIKEFFSINAASQNWPYTVSWVDLSATGSKAGRGIYMRGRASTTGDLSTHGKTKLWAPCNAPNQTLCPATVSAFNWLYRKRVKPSAHCHYDPFFFPLDGVSAWNRIYGARGFYQYQSVIPPEAAQEVTQEMLERVGKSRQGSFLAVMKTFGTAAEEGLLSFPKEGFTLAMDFANKGQKTLELLKELDTCVESANGRLYPAKDARISSESFQRQYPNWKFLEEKRDPKISSAFWERVVKGGL